MQLELKAPEKRTEVLYARISQANKNYIQRYSEKNPGVSEAAFVDHIISQYRKHASNKKKSTQRS